MVTEGSSSAPAADRGNPSTSYTAAATGWDELAGKLSVLARALQDETGVDATLRAIVAAATDTVPGAESASIAAVRKGREVATLVATGDLSRAVDQAQYDTGQGPGLDSLYQRRTVRLSNMAAASQWPLFAARARGIGLGSMLVIQLHVTGTDLGVLNLHSARPDAITDESEQTGLLFASHAAVALAGARHQEQLRTAISSRDVIGQAKGILMERHKVSADEAFQLLVLASQATNSKLADLALDLARTGILTSPRTITPAG